MQKCTIKVPQFFLFSVSLLSTFSLEQYFEVGGICSQIWSLKGKDTYAEPSACEVGWPVPLLGAFISPVFPLGTHVLLGEQ